MPDNAAIAESIFEAWEKRDFDAIVQNMVDDVVVNAPGPVIVNGKAAVKDWYASWATACPDGVAGATCVGATSDTAVMEGIYAGTNTGAFGPFTATGCTVSLPWTNVYRFDSAGKIANVNAYFDQVTLLTQLGHMEPLT
jgi:steroid delta-isomerase-like uncharacterized protein